MAKYSKLVFTLCVLCGLLLACNLTSVEQNQGDSDTALMKTQTVQAVDQNPAPTTTSTFTPVSPTTTKTPTVTFLIPPTSAGITKSKSITFRPGSTSIYNQEPIKTGEDHTYTLQASQGQTLIVTVSSSDNDVFLGVKGLQDDKELISTEDQSLYWTGTLPETQEYMITLTTDNTETSYFLSIEIPANIQFQPGSDSVTIDGFIDVHVNFHPNVITRIRYLAFASEGQTMTIELNSPNLDHLSVGVIGQEDGQRYIAYHVKNNGGELSVPISQGYYIDVYSTGGASTEFTLDISIK